MNELCFLNDLECWVNVGGTEGMAGKAPEAGTGRSHRLFKKIQGYTYSFLKFNVPLTSDEIIIFFSSLSGLL